MRWTIALIGAAALAALIVSSPTIAAEVSGYRLAGVRIAVSDYDKAIAFYTKLGMKAGEIYNARERQLKWDGRSQGSDIILYHSDGNGGLKLTPGTASLAFWVPDMKVTVEKLRNAGYPNVGEPRDMKTFLILLIKDPDGNSIELAQPISAAAK
jgi:catechol 2,3-dioxygenase-like lactoylglutathione lyase family enzyme